MRIDVDGERLLDNRHFLTSNARERWQPGELADLNHPLLSLVSPKFLQDRVGTYDNLRQGGYTHLVVYLAQQIYQFRLLGKEFAMQHLGAEDELKQVLRDLWATMSPEERLEVFPVQERLQGLSPEERLQGLAPEERLRGLAPEELERLRQLLQSQTRADNPSQPE